MATAASKRKRDSQDIQSMRPPPAMHGDNHDFAQSYISNDDDGMGNADSNIDFSTMLQNTDAPEGVDEQTQQPQQHPVHHAGAGPNSHQGQVPHGDQSASDTAAAAMAQYHHTMTVPQSTEQAFMRALPDENGNARAHEAGHSNAPQTPSFPGYDANAGKDDSHEQNGEISPSGGMRGTPGGSKPTVGSEEWHKQRKDNHKEVERRRRETINEGINELSKIVPGCEKNKGQILSRAVSFITQLKDNETQNIEKWTLEKLLMENTVNEQNASIDRLTHEGERARAECEAWKRAAQRAGITSAEHTADDGKAVGMAD